MVRSVEVASSSKSESKLKLLYDWQSVSMFRSRAHSGTCDQNYFLSEGFCLKVAVVSLWGALSDEKTGLQFAMQSLNGPSRAEPVTILYCLIWNTPNLEVQVPVFISPRNRVAQLYTQALGSFYVAPYDSQGYGGGIVTRLHTSEHFNIIFICL
jgi:hypothetical protein